MHFLCRSVIVFSLFFSQAAIATDTPAAPSASPTDVVQETTTSTLVEAIIDEPRDYVSEKFSNFANGIDVFFGSNRYYQESNRSVLQFDLTRTIAVGDSGQIKPKFRAKLHLPNTQKRFHLLIESNPDQNLPGATDQPGKTAKTSLFREVATPDSFGAALRIENDEESPWRHSADGGLKLENAGEWNNIFIQPFVRARTSYTLPWKGFQFQIAESVFWFNSIGLGETTQFDADYRFSDPILLRATSVATWLNDKQNFDLHQDFSCYQTLENDKSLLYQIGANGVTRPETQVSEYYALMLYRQRIHRDWVFFEVSPQLHYPRTKDYQVNSLLIFRLEVLFSK